jgi:hypothetical protein
VGVDELEVHGRVQSMPVGNAFILATGIPAANDAAFGGSSQNSIQASKFCL